MGIKDVVAVAKKDKKKMIWLSFLIVAAVFLLLVSQMLGNVSDETTSPSTDGATPTAPSADPLTVVEEELAASLRQIEGAGQVNVIIYWQSSTYREYGYNEDTTTRSEDTGSEERSTRREMVLLNGSQEPVLVRELLPDIAGVLVVADGAYRATIREELTTATATYLQIGAHKIQVSQRGDE